MLDYEVLRVIWWALVGVLLIGFAITDGFDMGVGALLPIIGKSDTERRVMINTIAPHWDGNQVWLITAGGAIFAAWPTVYATAFSGFYVAMVLTLMALFFRPVGFDYRSKIEDPRWRTTWDWCLFIGGAVPPIVFGVAFGNLLQGVPFTLDTFLRSSYEGNFFGLLNPFGLLAGIISLLMVLSQGAAWLMLKSDGALLARARGVASVTGLLTAILFAAAGYWIAHGIQGYSITEFAGIDPSRPLPDHVKQVIQMNVENTYQRFIQLVAKGRKMSPQAVDKIAQGRVWSGLDAKQLGLVDELGSQAEAITAAAKLAKLPRYQIQLIEPELSPSEQLMKQLLAKASTVLAPAAVHQLAELLGQGQAALAPLQRLDDPQGQYVLSPVVAP